MSLLYTPVFDRDMFDINDKYTNIIGFLINIDRVMFYDVLTNNWRFNTIIIE